VKTNCIIIRYGEIALKSKFTRKQFEKTLKNNINKALQKKDISFSLSSLQGRIIIFTEKIDIAVNIITHIFGITSCSPSFMIQTNIKQICVEVFSLISSYLNESQSFALRVSRTGDHSFTSQDIAITVGGYVQKQKKFTVDLNNPDMEVFIEIRDDKTFIFLEKIRGPGGMPMSSQGRVLSLINSSYDLLASWYLLKRGCFMFYLYSDEKILIQADNFFSTWNIPKHFLKYDKNQEYDSQIDEIIKKLRCQALCIGIVFSNNKYEKILRLKTLKKQVSVPILTPLISFNKSELKKLLEEKGIK
jgi:thiamine biosynthesis protein ThiI